ncbi:MAG: macro domain-containing protein [Gemmatimonadales bacterium]
MIRVVVDDLAFLPADAIVRPATAQLEPTTPALRRLEQLGGTEFQHQMELHTELVVGAAVVTAAGGDLPAEFVIHAVIQSRDEPISRRGVARAWRSALERAREWGFARLSVPPIGIGAGNLSLEDAAEILVSVLHELPASDPAPPEVAFVVENEDQREVFEDVLRRLRARLS